jgi:hypothetical protein
MTIYPDSSFLVAVWYRHDTFHGHAARFHTARIEETWLWSPWHRVEVFNTLRQLTLDPEGLTPSESRAIIRRLEADIRCDYLLHLEADWRDVLQTANESASPMPSACPAGPPICFTWPTPRNWPLSFS